MGNLRMGIPKDQIIFFKTQLNIDTFIETGTYKAQSSIWASQVFKNVHTIENSKAIFDDNIELIKKYPQINFHYGHSKVILTQILENLKSEAIIWLDAHWSGMDTYGENDECPLIDEINTIITSNPNHIILIDDARLFLMPPPLPHLAKQWPSIKEIVLTFNQSEQYIVVFEDVIIAVPPSAKEMMCEYFQDISTLNWNQKSGAQIKEGLIQIKDGILRWFK